MSSEPTRPTPGQSIFRLAQTLAGPTFSMGDQAALRRMDLSAPGRAALPLQRLLAAAEVAEIENPSAFRRWALVVHCLAIMRGRIDMGVPAGGALFALGLTEARLNQLLAADEDVLFDLLPRIARRVAAQGAAFDWRPLARLVLGDAEAAEAARLGIARAYARAQAA
jgi:hypothetical protein